MHKRIRKIRCELKLTQQVFANKIGIRQNSVALIEAGKRNASNQTVCAICREFNVNEDWLRTGEGEMFILPNEDTKFIQLCTDIQASKDSCIQNIIRAYWSLTLDDKIAIQHFIDKLSVLQSEDE